jgi:hypothetical protein
MFYQTIDSRKKIDEIFENSESAHRGMSEEEFAQQDAQLFRIQSNCSKVQFWYSSTSNKLYLFPIK